MKIAIVGAGVSGLTAAYLLNRAHDIDLFERNDYAGGHANTVTVRAGGRDIGLDAGFLVYNEHTYPGFTRLLSQLNVDTKQGDMSISVRCGNCRMEYSTRGLRGMLAQRSNSLRPDRWMLGVDILRFYRDTQMALQHHRFDSLALEAFLRARRYGGEFVRHFIMPLASAVWSTPPGEVGAFPVRYFLQFLQNHGFIGLQPAFVWRTVAGGSQQYVERMTATFPRALRLSTPVRTIRREADGVRVVAGDGTCRTYDRVVLACHADEALALLADPSDDERRALGGFSYASNHTVLHTDAAMLPERRDARASWNYFTANCRSGGGPLGMTYHLNRLQALDEPVDYCVSLNAAGVHPETVIREMTYDHPRYTFETLRAQQQVERINGERRTFYAGAHLGHGFHEDGLVSGVRVAERFGVTL